MIRNCLHNKIRDYFKKYTYTLYKIDNLNEKINDLER